jgi:NAD dependent epimerase/dehydratase family enzyme
VATVVLEGQKVLPKHLQALGYEFKFPNAEVALQDLYGKEAAVVA